MRGARATIEERVLELAEQMRAGKSDQLRQFLAFAARFHRYSVGNQILIWAQRPEATQVAGLKRWNELGRHVRPGERGLMIFAPIRYRRESSKEILPAAEEVHEIRESREVLTFRTAYVFDVAQTHGADLPTVIAASGDAERVLPAIRQAIGAMDIELIEASTLAHRIALAGAEAASCGGKIIIRSELEGADAFRALAHEMAHEILHHGEGERPDKMIRETEADAAAFVVCGHFGIEADSADYLQLYDSTPEVLLDRLENIRGVAGRIIDAITAQLEPRPAGAEQDASDRVAEETDD